MITSLDEVIKYLPQLFLRKLLRDVIFVWIGTFCRPSMLARGYWLAED